MDTKTVKGTKQNPTPHLKLLPYILTHNSRNIEACNTSVQNLPMLTRDPKTKHILQTYKSIKCKKKTTPKKNTDKCETRFNNMKQIVKKYKCPNCGTQLNLLAGLEFHLKWEQRFTIETNFTCIQRFTW